MKKRNKLLFSFAVLAILPLAIASCDRVPTPLSCNTNAARQVTLYIKLANDIFYLEPYANGQPTDICACDIVTVKNQTGSEIAIAMKQLFGHDRKIAIRADGTSGPYNNKYAEIQNISYTISGGGKSISGAISLRCNSK